MSIESFIFFALFTTGGGSSSLKAPKMPGSTGVGSSNGGGKLSKLTQKAGSAAAKAGSAYQRAEMGAMTGGTKGALKGGAKGLEKGGLPGALAGAARGGIGGALKGGLDGLRGKGGNDASKIPTQDLRASKEGNRGFLPQPKIPGLNKAKKQIPKEDLRSQVANATDTARKLNNLRKLNSPQGMQNALNGIKSKFGKGKEPKSKAAELKKAATEKAIRAAGNLGGIYGKAAAEIIILIKNHRQLFITLIGVLILFFFMIFDPTTFDPPQQGGTPGTPTTSDTCNPAQFSGNAFGKTTVCTITVNYAGSAQDISISDIIMPGTKLVSATNNGLPDATQTTVLWDAKQDGLTLNPVNITVSVILTITTTKTNIKIFNAYSISPTGLSGASNNGSTTIPGNLPPSTDNCSGIYSYYMGITPGHQNYGDPTCTLIKKDPNGTAIINKDAILSELKTLKPSEAMGWFICVVPNESGYNANAYLGASTSGYGAYGLVQMNPTGKGNGQYDNGQVVWPLQLSNGINYNDKNIGHTFSYWPKSYDSCLNNYGVTVN